MSSVYYFDQLLTSASLIELFDLWICRAHLHRVHQQVRVCPVHRYTASDWLRPPRSCMIAGDILCIHQYPLQTCTDQADTLRKKTQLIIPFTGKVPFGYYQDSVMNIFTGNIWIYLRWHSGMSSLHCLLLKHSVLLAPINLYPGKQENWTTLPKEKVSPSFDPDSGAIISAHPTAV